ncbi:helix-turn-helix domain-containing protein [Nocardia gipuzkoensis]
MGRRRKPVAEGSPVGRFAARLRDRIDQDPTLTYRKMAEQVNYSHSTLAEAVSGKKLPTWDVTLAVLQSCEADEEEIREWKQYWHATHRLGARFSPIPEEELTTEAAPEPDTAGDDSWRPRPDRIRTFDDLAYELRRFRLAVGNPTLRELQRLMCQPIWNNPYSVTSLSDVFNGKRRPRVGMYRTLVQIMLMRSHTLYGASERHRPWQSEYDWIDAWSRAEFDREKYSIRPGRERQPGNDPLVVPSERERFPTGEIVKEKPKVAANLLSTMQPHVVSGIITSLPAKTAEEILTAVLELHRQSKATPPKPRSMPSMKGRRRQ